MHFDLSMYFKAYNLCVFLCSTTRTCTRVHMSLAHSHTRRRPGCCPHLAKGALADGAVQIEVEEVDLAVKIDGVRARTADTTHARNEGNERGYERGGEARYYAREV